LIIEKFELKRPNSINNDKILAIELKISTNNKPLAKKAFCKQIF